MMLMSPQDPSTQEAGPPATASLDRKAAESFLTGTGRSRGLPGDEQLDQTRIDRACDMGQHLPLLSGKTAKATHLWIFWTNWGKMGRSHEMYRVPKSTGRGGG